MGSTVCVLARRLGSPSEAIARAGPPADRATLLAEEYVGGIQGALTLARALNEDGIFERTIAGLSERLEKAIKQPGLV
jgi:hypothetical protein